MSKPEYVKISHYNWNYCTVLLYCACISESLALYILFWCMAIWHINIFIWGGIIFISIKRFNLSFNFLHWKIYYQVERLILRIWFLCIAIVCKSYAYLAYALIFNPLGHVFLDLCILRRAYNWILIFDSTWTSFFFFNFFIFWLCWLFVAARRLSVVATSVGYSLLWCADFSLRCLLLFRSMGSRRVGFSSCTVWAQ